MCIGILNSATSAARSGFIDIIFEVVSDRWKKSTEQWETRRHKGTKVFDFLGRGEIFSYSLFVSFCHSIISLFYYPSATAQCLMGSPLDKVCVQAMIFKLSVMRIVFCLRYWREKWCFFFHRRPCLMAHYFVCSFNIARTIGALPHLVWVQNYYIKNVIYKLGRIFLFGRSIFYC